MEWQVSKSYSVAVDGYDGYELTGFMDGYRGMEEYDIDSMFVPVHDVARIMEGYDICTEKIAHYTSLESPTEKIEGRLAETRRKHVDYFNMMYAIREFEGE